MFLQRHGGDQIGAAPCRCVDLEAGAENGKPFADAEQSESRARRRPRVESDAVVRNAAAEDTRQFVDLEQDMRGARMPADVCESFLNETVDRGLDRRRNRAVDTARDGDGETGADERAGREAPDRRRQSELVEDARPQFMRERSELLFDRVQIFLDLHEMLADRRGGNGDRFRQRVVRGDQHLATLIVKRLADRSRLRFERGVQPAQDLGIGGRMAALPGRDNTGVTPGFHASARRRHRSLGASPASHKDLFLRVLDTVTTHHLH